MRDPWYLIN